MSHERRLYQPALSAEIKDAERRVIEAAEAWREAYRVADGCGESEDEACIPSECLCWIKYGKSVDTLSEAVRALRSARGEG